MRATELLERYVALHNRGVLTRTFEEMLRVFAEDAVFDFVGISAGPFQGREEIGRAFQQHPPDDELRIEDVSGDESEARARYAWRSSPGKTEGTLHVRARRNLIIALRVTRDRA